MAQHPIEIILLQQWASSMGVPIWITDAAGNLVYFNEATEALLGITFEEADNISAAEVSARFHITDLDGSELPEIERPLIIALSKQLPAQRRLLARAESGNTMVISDVAIPIVGEGNRPLGAMVFLWDVGEDHA